MKRIYWRPRQVSRPMLLFISLLALLGLLAVEQFKVTVRQSDYEEKLAAARLAREAMESVREFRLRQGLKIDLETDPAGSGLIGTLMTPVTSDPGLLRSKQTTVNPNFAAVVVEMLREAEVGAGDPVAVGLSGSFPAMNICVLAALKTLQARPIIISSGAASQWGANEPNFLWLDIEKWLSDEGLFPFRSAAASLGGIEDRGLGMSDEGIRIIRAAIERQGLRLISTQTFQENIDERMAIYHEGAAGAGTGTGGTAAGDGSEAIKAYVNVGGGTISVGTSVGKRLFRPGLNTVPPRGISTVDSVMTRFIASGVPVLHFVQITDLAEEYGLPIAPTTLPTVGEGTIFVKREHNRWLAAGVLFTLLASLYGFVRSDLGFRLLQPRSSGAEQSPQIEQMV